MSYVIRLRHQRALLVPAIVAIDILVFFAWQADMSSVGYMAQNFSVSWTALSEGRYWVLLTSAFSHNMLLHIFINMYVLMSFGSFLERFLGRGRFLNFYLIAAVVSSLAHAAVSAFVLGQPSLPAVGASGALAGLILVFSFCFPREKILIFGIIPVAAIWGALAFVALDIWGLIEQSHGGGLPIGHGAHLGGAVTGVVYYWLVLRRRK